MIKQEAIVQESRSFIGLSEEALLSLMAQLPAAPTEDAREVLALVRAAARLAHAYQSYPVFDWGCLSLMREDAGLHLFVPKFAFADLKAAFPLRQVWSPKSHSAPFHAGRAVYYPPELIGRNAEALDRPHAPPADSFTVSRKAPVAIVPSERALAELHALRSRLESQAPVDRTQLTANAPSIPASVCRRINAASPEFDAMKLVWEAEWKAAPVQDPLVIGLLGDRCFLVDQYDVTKLERYIVSEMCQNPRTSPGA